MSRILSIEQIHHKDSCFLHGCGGDAKWLVQIQHGPAIIKPCLCNKHARMTPDEILAALDGHKHTYR